LRFTKDRRDLYSRHAFIYSYCHIY
jgi:hypothetical protein